jgi:hypothetical protein
MKTTCFKYCMGLLISRNRSGWGLRLSWAIGDSFVCPFLSDGVIVLIRICAVKRVVPQLVCPCFGVLDYTAKPTLLQRLGVVSSPVSSTFRAVVSMSNLSQSALSRILLLRRLPNVFCSLQLGARSSWGVRLCRLSSPRIAEIVTAGQVLISVE